MTTHDLTGRRFGRLTVVSRAENGKYGQVRWLCKCSCGESICTDARNLKTGKTKSCGCFRREFSRAKAIRHGHAIKGKLSPEYISYTNAKQRCENPSHKSYRHYGGRGIEFRYASFEEFYADLGPRPPGKTLERISNHGPRIPVPLHSVPGANPGTGRVPTQGNR
jgi:hypothetical protein